MSLTDPWNDQPTSEKGQANGYAALDGTGKVPAAQLPTDSDVWGGITGTLANQTDLQSALDAKAPTANPTFTGTVTIPDGALAIADTSGLQTALDGKASTTHATTHQSGGSDPIKLDDLSAPDDNTDLNASTSVHGLMQKYPGGTTDFLRADGTFAAPPGGSGLTEAQVLGRLTGLGA